MHAKFDAIIHVSHLALEVDLCVCVRIITIKSIKTLKA